MIKHFCDICGKYLTVCNKALSNTALITRELDEMNRPLYHTIKGMEICDECACTLCDVMDALKRGKEVNIR